MKFLNKLLVAGLCLATSWNAIADDFTVVVPSTKDYAHYLPPIKPGASHVFTVNVKNNLSKTTVVSISKDDFGGLKSWISIEDNSQELTAGQSKNFSLTVNVPSNADDYDYGIPLYFSAYDKANHNIQYNFTYTTQVLIVDKSTPNTPSFNMSSTYNSVYVSNWYSYDAKRQIKVQIK